MFDEFFFLILVANFQARNRLAKKRAHNTAAKYHKIMFLSLRIVDFSNPSHKKTTTKKTKFLFDFSLSPIPNKKKLTHLKKLC